MKKIMKIITFLVVAGLFTNGASANMISNDDYQLNNNRCAIPIDSIEPKEKKDIVYNSDGEIVKFSVILDESEYDAATMRSSAAGRVKFEFGVCFIIELFLDYGCIDFARDLGLSYIEGLWYMSSRPYTGEWKVTYGYIQGCYPEHSGGCYRATYEKL